MQFGIFGPNQNAQMGMNILQMAQRMNPGGLQNGLQALLQRLLPQQQPMGSMGGIGNIGGGGMSVPQSPGIGLLSGLFGG